MAELDEPTRTLINSAHFVLMLWHQQPEVFPLTFTDLGLTPLQVRELIGIEAWSRAFEGDTLPTLDAPLPRLAIGTLTTAVQAISLQASAPPTEVQLEHSRKVMAGAAAAAASKRNAVTKTAKKKSTALTLKTK